MVCIVFTAFTLTPLHYSHILLTVGEDSHYLRTLILMTLINY